MAQVGPAGRLAVANSVALVPPAATMSPVPAMVRREGNHGVRRHRIPTPVPVGAFVPCHCGHAAGPAAHIGRERK